jgi:hypothetical protein
MPLDKRPSFLLGVSAPKINGQVVQLRLGVPEMSARILSCDFTCFHVFFLT